jgi:hypothetical protein
VQELRGNQQFWMAVVPVLASLLGATNALSAPGVSSLASPKGSRAQQSRAWTRFWEGVELQRILVEGRQEWGARFMRPLLGALRIQEALALPGVADKVVWVWDDAALERLEAVDWTHKTAMSVEARVYFDMLLQTCREVEKAPEFEARSNPEDGEPEADGDTRSASVEAEGRLPEELLIVALTEVLALVIMASASTLLWEGKVMLYLGDDQEVIAWVGSRQAARPVARYLL